MNKLLIAIALCAALAACKKEDAAPAADTAATPAADSAAAMPADTAAAPVNAGLPADCEQYLNRAKACFAKANPQMAAQFQQAIDQSTSKWESMNGTDSAAVVQACKQANDQFSQTVAMLKCE